MVGPWTVGSGAATQEVTIVHGDVIHNYASLPERLLSLHQLPTPPRLVGRDEALAELEADARRAGVAIAGVRGLGGIGKTAIALVLAHRIAPDYPDAQIYLDLRGVQAKEAMTKAAALSHVIRAFNLNAKLPEDEASLRTLFNSTLHGKRVLLLMDNALDAAQVEPLIPPAGSVLIVTSRQRFSVGGLPLKDIGILNPDRARELLLALAPMAGAHAEAIVRACGCLPLAIHLAASALQAPGGLPPAEYAKQLADSQGRQRLRLLKPLPAEATPELSAVFGLSYGLLKAPQQTLWRRLALFPASFDLPAAAAVWGLNEATARETLQEFAAHSLVEFDAERRRFRLHDLLRDFADSLLPDAERAAGSLAHAEHYLKVAASADQNFLSGGQGVLQGLSLFDAEWLHIQAGQAWSAANQRRDEAAAKLTNAYPGAGIYCLSLRLHSKEQVSWFTAALEAARRLGLRLDEGTHLGNLGLAYARLGDAKKAITHHEQALAISREIGDRQGEGADLGNLGNAHARLGDAKKAITHHEQALAISREIGDRQGEGADLGNLGNAHARLGDARTAITHEEQALLISREVGDRRGEGNRLGNLGIAYASLGDTQSAIARFEQALLISREVGDRRGEGNHLGNLGLVYADLGDSRKAIAEYEQALLISREIGDRRGEGNHLGNLGSAHARLGDTRGAIDHYEQALAISREVGDRRGESNRLGNLGLAHADLGDTKTAIAHHEQALAISRDISDRRGEGNHLGNLGSAHARLGDTREAIDHYEQALAISRDISDRRGEGNHLGNLGLAHADLGDTKTAIAHYEQALAISRGIGDKMGTATHLHNLSSAQAKSEDAAPAGRNAREAVALFEELGAAHQLKAARKWLATLET